MKKCIVSVCDKNSGVYAKSLDRLEESLDRHAKGIDRLIWRGSLPPGSPTHQAVPYGFKAYALMEAKRQGYDLVIWADANTWLIRDIDPVFDYIEKHGYMFLANYGEAGIIGKWSSDACIAAFGKTREEAFEMKEIMACCFGLDLRKENCNKFLQKYYDCASDGVTYLGAWHNDKHQVSVSDKVKGHRHDQTVASLTLHELDMLDWLVPYESFLYYWDDNWGNVKSSIVFFKRGM